MAKCINCGRQGAEYEYSEGGFVCENCVGGYFTCPDCGRVFPIETGDAGNGFCSDCASDH